MNLLDDIFLAVIIIVIGSAIWFVLLWTALGTEPPEIRYTEMYGRCAGNIIQGNSLIAISPLPFTPPVVLSSLMEKIILCESTWNCEAENSETKAWGYCQFMPSTMDYIQQKWGERIDFSDPEQQLYACQRLYEEEGDIHWLASKNCWDK